ncbi:fatty acid desaturase [Clostridium pasteurianum]|uniref:Fatty acid desaturase n=1 Tax=Clostridium pasteurianum BC1 TaxID=86416 RepID=R4JWE9_CLOPA|nr:fatty acid desaturase [Clostridium pasteurianum]AGK95152.1 fatty acid desaturase [Clostridium pasteurianum BC1]
MEYISKNKICREKWKFYFVLLAWPLYLFLMPMAYKYIGYFSVIIMIFPGAYLFTWLGFLMHECWHKYVPEINNKVFYKVFSWFLLNDPQTYNLIHGIHHSKVNSWEDIEFHPLGKIKNTLLRRLYNLMEIIFGIAFVSFVVNSILPYHKDFKNKYSRRSQVLSIIMYIIIYGGLVLACHYAFNIGYSTIVILYIVNLWIVSFVLHHSQLIEHGNLVLEGNYKERNVKTRNLSNDGILEKIFLFLTHGDSREHVLHHTLPGVYSRPFPRKVPMPAESMYINLKDYMKILWVMLSEKI